MVNVSCVCLKESVFLYRMLKLYIEIEELKVKLSESYYFYYICEFMEFGLLVFLMRNGLGIEWIIFGVNGYVLESG